MRLVERERESGNESVSGERHKHENHGMLALVVESMGAVRAVRCEGDAIHPNDHLLRLRCNPRSSLALLGFF